MIEITAEITGLKSIINMLTKVERAFFDMTVPMEAVQKELVSIMKKKFDSFQKHGGAYKDKKYLVDKGARRVGVKTGQLKRAFWGGPGNINLLSEYGGVANAMLEWGIDLSAFEREYPKYFAGWLEAKGDDLIDLDDDDIDRLNAVFIKALYHQIERTQ